LESLLVAFMNRSMPWGGHLVDGLALKVIRVEEVAQHRLIEFVHVAQVLPDATLAEAVAVVVEELGDARRVALLQQALRINRGGRITKNKKSR
jgi:hypothetical protein